MNSKARAYTLLEVTVAMVIAAVCIGVVYSAYLVVTKSYMNFDERNRGLSELLLADKLLKKDFLNARKINRIEDGIKVELDSVTINYRFTEQILRNHNDRRIDTFNVDIKEIEYYFEGRTAESLVDELKLTVTPDGKVVSLIYEKLYCAADFVHHGVTNSFDAASQSLGTK